MIVAISGIKGSGKDTAAHMLQYLLNSPRVFRSYFWYKLKIKFPKKWRIISFAKPVKKVLSTILGVDVNRFNDRDFKENYFVQLDTFKIVEKYLLDDEDILSDNKFIKLIKTGNPIPTNTWLSIRQLMQYFATEVAQTYLGRKVWINSTLKTDKDVIVSDLRFKEEFNAVKEKNGIIIYIQRDLAKPGTHASEREMYELYTQSKFDYVINNNATLKDLFNDLKEIWKVEK